MKNLPDKYKNECEYYISQAKEEYLDKKNKFVAIEKDLKNFKLENLEKSLNKILVTKNNIQWLRIYKAPGLGGGFLRKIVNYLIMKKFILKTMVLVALFAWRNLLNKQVQQPPFQLMLW